MTPAKPKPAQPNSSVKQPIPLTHLAPGTFARVVGANHGIGQIHRLASMGLTAGSELILVTGGPPGPVIVEVRGTRYIIGRGMAQNIMVIPAKAQAHRHD